MAKVHLQANKGERMEPFAFCASQMDRNGRVSFNGRSSYRFMRSTIVRGQEFISTPAEDRCAHCVDVLRQRKAQRPNTYRLVCGEG
jgi:hypothetical protein